MTPFATKTLVRIGAGLCFTGLVVWLMHALESVTTILMVSFFIAYILNPFALTLSKYGIGRIPAAVISLLLVFAFFLGLVLLIVPAIAGELSEFSALAPKYFKVIQGVFFEIVSRFDIPFPQDMNELSTIAIERGRQLLPGITKALGQVVSSVFTSTISILAAIFQVLLIPIIAYYLLVSFENIKSGAIELLPLYTRDAIIKKFREIDQVLASFVRGQLTIALMMAVLYSFGFLVIGIDLALVLGIISGLLFIVPYLGTMVALIFGPIMAFAKFGDVIHVLYVLFWIGGVQAFESYVLTPRIVGQAVGLHPVVYIIALIVGGNLFGFVGMLVAIPVAAVLRVLLLTLLEEYKRSYLYHDKPGKDPV